MIKAVKFPRIKTRPVKSQAQVGTFRLCAGVLACAACVYEQSLNRGLQYMYTWLLKQPFFRWDSFEVVQSTLCFMSWIALFFVFDYHIPSMRKFRFNVLASHKDGEGETCEKNNLVREELLAWRGREVAIYQEVAWYLLPWMLYDFYTPRRDAALLRASDAAPDLRTLVTQVTCSLLAYDAFFYVGHRAFHHWSLKLHCKHHTSKAAVRAIDAVRHTFWDGTFDVFCSVFALKLVGSHPLCRIVHNVIATYLITELHSGYELPWSLSQLAPALLITPRHHQAHHADGACNYGKFFTLLDKLCGTFRGCDPLGVQLNNNL